VPSRATNQQVADLIGPIYKLLEKGAIGAAETSIAGLALWVVDCIEDRRLRAELADEAFTLLVVHMGDRGELPLSNETQELLLEGQHLHHYRDSVGADLGLMRELAGRILAKSGR
jgi:hypothetical protein